MEVIDLDVMDLHATPRWAPTIMIYDNEFVWGWSQDRENNGNT
jgi:hypothetical protein